MSSSLGPSTIEAPRFHWSRDVGKCLVESTGSRNRDLISCLTRKTDLWVSSLKWCYTVVSVVRGNCLQLAESCWPDFCTKAKHIVKLQSVGYWELNFGLCTC
jgi:hypothetical protein